MFDNASLSKMEDYKKKEKSKKNLIVSSSKSKNLRALPTSLNLVT
jgi:hypothetical protein